MTATYFLLDRCTDPHAETGFSSEGGMSNLENIRLAITCCGARGGERVKGVGLRP